MVARIISGVIGIPIAIVLIFLSGGLPFTVAVGIIAVLGMMEFFRGAHHAGARPNVPLGVAMGLAVIVMARFAAEGRSLVHFPLVFSLLLLAMLIRELTRRNCAPFKNIGATLLGVAYVGLFANMVLLRGLDGWMDVWRWHSEKAAWLVLFVFMSTWACDTAAYFIGRKYGTRKLVPRLSPGKTVEGSVAGFIGAFIMAAIIGAVIKLPAAHSLILGALIGVFCQVGDLVESSMKREIGIKDFGSILPGHGGALDRFDSLLFTSTVTYYYVIYLVKGWLG